MYVLIGCHSARKKTGLTRRFALFCEMYYITVGAASVGLHGAALVMADGTAGPGRMCCVCIPIYPFYSL